MSRYEPQGRYDRRDVLRAGCGLTAVLAASRALAQVDPTPIGTVEEIRGEAHAETNGARRMLQVKGWVFVGDLLATGSNARLVLKLGPATTIKLGGESRLRIDRYLAETGGEFNMLAGHMQFERKGKPVSEGITFRSAYGLMAVRGTRFYAGPNRGTFAVLVGEGVLEVTAAQRSVMVRAQEGIDIKAPGQAPTAPARWAAPRIREMLSNFS